MSVLSNYKVKFGVKIFFNTEFEFISSINESLSAFIGTFRDSNSVNQLFDSADKALSYPDLNSNTTYPAQSMMLAVIKKSTTTIYDEVDKYENPNYTADFELPTSDFKVIVEAWRDYLKSRGK
ncbi:hypothetical protein ATE47_05500 [Chryseobacterium sp. IHB B 17019]|uniref:hypothetical protein n=1 Tax=Chryseobacterium sp. IHB B 17019 TaxID=1721091 RepID=UPI00071F4916|nr:hypothetical protein [Chryseobacterium sp. IHB B 17019]ALR30010.1 hypothetical protein ATE47_05500 [Chryseobacterium sp. IHB B 17019]